MVVTEGDRNKVKEYFKQAVKETEAVQEAQAAVTDIVNTLKSDHDIPPKLSRQIISVMRKGNAPELKEYHEMFDDLCEVVSK